ncbi:MAG TPA: hypothetical protein VFQ53_29945 [Kofleriaceae bacterium]|nr:hypothetical protein [Kofleriaceae bacterium]
MKPWRSIWIGALVIASTPGCGGTNGASPDGGAAADASDRCSAEMPDVCTAGTLCANDRCKPVCPGPGGVGQSCGQPGSMCCGLGELCLTGGALACTDSCTPFADTCPAGFGCHVLSDHLLEYSDCRPAGAGGQGASCVTSADCARGSFCIGGDRPMCVRYCTPNDATHGCDAGTTCHNWQFLDGVPYGICF